MKTVNAEKTIEITKTSTVYVQIARVLDEGKYVSVHYQCTENGVKKASIDVYRFENGEVTERLSNSQDIPEDSNPSGHTMLDGPVEVTELEKSNNNKEFVEALYSAIMNGHPQEMPTFFDGDKYINHNPEAYDGLSGFAKGMKERVAKGIVTKYDRIVLAFGAGNFVQLVTEGSLSGVPTKFFDIFRVENGKIAEHWDVVG